MSHEDSPFMRPEFVLEHDQRPGARSSASVRASLFDLQHRLLQQQARDRLAASASRPLSTSGSRPASPFLKPPKVIKHDQDDSWYVKVEDLPEDVRDQVNAMAAEDSNIGGSVAHDDAAIPAPRRTRTLPFSEPTRLSAQPTVEEIQMSFAQVDLAILMETKPATTNSNSGTTLRSAGATTASGGSGARAAARRRERLGAQSHESTPNLPNPAWQASRYAESDQSESDNMSYGAPTSSKAGQFPRPVNAAATVNLSNAQPPSRMQQLLTDLASSRHNRAAPVINTNDQADYEDAANAARSKPKPVRSAAAAPWPPFAVSSSRSRRNSRSDGQTQHNFSFFRDDFLNKLEEIQALAEAGPIRSNLENTDIARASTSGSKRAYQMPVWTHGASSSTGGAAPAGGGGRVRYQNSWSGQSQGEYELLDPLVDAASGSLAGHTQAATSAADIMQADTASTDTESLAP